jgi:2-oxoglutarate ferredoxin oxidoreductase subunit gamma
VALNLPSFDKYEHLVAAGGVLVVNASLITRHSQRTDVRVLEVPANAIADGLGSLKLANLVMTGALVAATKMLPLEAVARALTAHLPARHRNLLEANRLALLRGAALVDEVAV